MQIRYLCQDDALAVQRLLRSGLAERWGDYDASFNPDIEQLWSSYQGRMLVGEINQQIVACGAWKLAPVGRIGKCAEIVRVSTAADYRGQGLAKKMILAIEGELIGMVDRVEVETTANWVSAVKLYLAMGYQKTHRRGGDQYFVKNYNQP